MEFTILVSCLYFFVFPALIATLIQKKLNKDGSVSAYAIVYVELFYLLMTIVKSILGEASVSIFESFEENSKLTYIHYCIPIFGIAILIPFLISKIKNRYEHLPTKLEFAAAVMFSINTVVFMANGMIPNIVCVISGVIGVILCAFIPANSLSRYSDLSKKDKRYRLRQGFSVIVFWAVEVVIYIPNKLYLTNPEEFHIRYIYFFLTLFMCALTICVLMVAVGTVILPDKIFDIWILIIFAISFMGYMQENFLNGKLSNMDGSEQIWSSQQRIINIIIWIFVCSLIIVIYSKLNKKLIKVICIAVVYLSLIQLFTIGYLAFSMEKEENTDILTRENVFELSDKDNVIVFVLDWYDEQILDEILKDDPDFLEPLDGFTCYTNQTSRYGFTFMSIPYLLTDVKWEYGMTEYDYIEYSYANSTFLNDISNNGYSIGIYSDPQAVRNYSDVIFNYVKSRGGCRVFQTFLGMTECSRYKMSPFVLKNHFHFSSGDMTQMLKVNDYNMYDTNNYIFNKYLIDNGIELKDESATGAFRFYHLSGCHDLNTDENIEMNSSDIYSCGKGAIKIVFNYIEELKRLGIYDDSVIIITADHGQNLINDDEKKREDRKLIRNTSNPILMVKGRDSRGSVIFSDAPVSHDDFFATIIEAVHGNNESYGKTYEEISSDETRIREFEFYRTGDIPYTKYTINGNVSDINNWVIEEKP